MRATLLFNKTSTKLLLAAVTFVMTLGALTPSAMATAQYCLPSGGVSIGAGYGYGNVCIEGDPSSGMWATSYYSNDPAHRPSGDVRLYKCTSFDSCGVMSAKSGTFTQAFLPNNYYYLRVSKKALLPGYFYEACSTFRAGIHNFSECTNLIAF